MKGKIRTLDTSGDTTLEWDTADPETITKADQTVEEFLAKGYTAFVVERALEDGSTTRSGGTLKHFDPTAIERILVSPLKGG